MSDVLRFTIVNGVVTEVFEVRAGIAERERIDANEMYVVRAPGVIRKSETYATFREIKDFSDPDGDGTYVRTAESFENFAGIPIGGAAGPGATPIAGRDLDPGHGYRFVITNGMVTSIVEVENGVATPESIGFGETYVVNGALVIKTEIEHGFTRIETYADADGDGIFSKVARMFQAQQGSGTAGDVDVTALLGGSDRDDDWVGSSSDDRYYGASGNDRLRAGAGDDRLYGGNGDDDLAGDDGDDHLFGSGGDDRLAGGRGIDHAFFTGSRSDYAFQRTITGVVVTDSNRLRDGSDTLESVERVHFADAGIAFDVDGVAGAAYRLYRTALDREPDHGGIGYWIARLDDGISLEQAARGFVGSTEFTGLYGAGVVSSDFIRLLYLNALDRNPDAGGLAYWVDQLDRGLQTREQVVLGFSESAELRSNVVQLVVNGIQYQDAGV